MAGVAEHTPNPPLAPDVVTAEVAVITYGVWVGGSMVGGGTVGVFTNEEVGVEPIAGAGPQAEVINRRHTKNEPGKERWR